MDIDIDAPDQDLAVRARQLLCFYLTGLERELGQAAIRIAQRSDPLGTRLYVCDLSARLRSGREIALTETQSDLVLAITRLLDRTVRTLRRRAIAGR